MCEIQVVVVGGVGFSLEKELQWGLGLCTTNCWCVQNLCTRQAVTETHSDSWRGPATLLKPSPQMGVLSRR